MADPFEQELHPPGAGPITSDMLFPEDRLGAFRIKRCLCFSLLGALYEISSSQKSQLVLVLPTALNHEKTFSDRLTMFIDELKEIEHESLLRVERFAKTGGRYCIFFEQFLGDTLEARLNEKARGEARPSDIVENPPTASVAPDEIDDEEALLLPPTELAPNDVETLSEKEVKQIVRAVGSLFHSVHETGIHHYSFTTSSILVSREDPTKVKVWGFGIYELIGARLFEKVISAGVPPIAQAYQRSVINPVEYLSPEVRRGANPDARSDMYSLGYVAYQLLTGRKPVTPLKPPSSVNASITPVWNRMLAVCLDQDPAQRYPSIAVMLNVLEGHDTQSPASEEAKMETVGQLKKISIPEEVPQQKGTNVARIVILSGVAIVLLLAGLLTFRWVSGRDQEGRISVVNSVAQAQISIAVNAQNAKAHLSGAASGTFFIDNAALHLAMPPGDYRIRVEAPLFNPVSRSITVDAGMPSQGQPFILKPQWADLEILAPAGSYLFSTQGDALAYIAEIPDAGKMLVENRLFQTQYDFLLLTPDHHPVRWNAVVLSGDATTRLEASPEPLPGALEISSNPPGATIWIDSQARGQTPSLVDTLPVGQDLLIEVTLPGFRPQQTTVTLEPGERRFVNFATLERALVMVTYQLESLRGRLPDSQAFQARIFVDGTQVTDADVAEFFVSPGKRRIRIEHDSFKAFEEEIQVIDGRPESRIAQLEPLPGHLVLGLPSQFNVPYEVLVDGQVMASSDRRYSIPPWREVTVLFRTPDYLPVRKSMILEPGEEYMWEVELQRIPPPSPGNDWTVPGLGITMSWVPGGSFIMGSPPEEPGRLPNEGDGSGRPIAMTMTRGLWVGRMEISQAIYSYVMGENPSEFPGPSRPVERVSWHDASAFCDRLTQRENAAHRMPQGYEYRLPTQAEWEYAARAGSDTPFTWGTSAGTHQGNFKGSYPRDYSSGDVNVTTVYGTVNVGSYAPNAHGLYDVHGNVREWCIDPYTERYPSGRHTDDFGALDTGARPVRGGSWEDFAVRCRSAARDGLNARSANRTTGFRVVLAPVYSGN